MYPSPPSGGKGSCGEPKYHRVITRRQTVKSKTLGIVVLIDLILLLLWLGTMIAFFAIRGPIRVAVGLLRGEGTIAGAVR